MTKDKTETKKLLRQYAITWRFPGNLCASVPKSEDIIKKWLESRMPKTKPAEAKSIEEIQQEVVETMLTDNTEQENKEKLQLACLGFQKMEGKLVVRGGTIRAHLKDCARIISKLYVGKIEKEATFAWKFTQAVYVEEYWIPILGKTGQPIMEPHGVMERMVHAMGPHGPVNALKAIDFVTGGQLKFHLKVLHGISLKDIENVMTYGALHGYAGERSTGEGRYIWEIKEVA